MKIIIFISLLFLSTAAYSVEFYRCLDASGKVHLTTMPKSSLDANCRQKTDHFAALLQQDYLNLSNEFKKYEVTVEDDTSGNQPSEFSIGDTKFKIPGKHIFDSDAAYEELMETTSKRDDPITNFFRARTDTIESILLEERPINASSNP